MVKHLIIKVRRIFFKICLKTSACFMIFNILSLFYSVLDKSKRKKKANYSIYNVLKSKFYHKQEYHTGELQCFVLHVCCKSVCILIYTKYSHCKHSKETNFGFFFHFP